MGWMGDAALTMDKASDLFFDYHSSCDKDDDGNDDDDKKKNSH